MASDTVMAELERRDPRERFRTFVVLWASQALSFLGHLMTLFALRSWINTTLYPDPSQEAQAATANTILFLSLTVVRLLAMPVAGAWADRQDRKRIMLTANVINATLAAGMAVLIATDQLTMPLVVPFIVLMSVGAGFHQSALEAAYSMLVPKGQLPRANGMMQTLMWLGNVLSPGLAAAVILLPGLARSGSLGTALNWVGSIENGAALAIGLDAISLLVAALVLLFLNVPSPRRQELSDATDGPGQPSVWADVRTGAHYVWLRRPLIWLLLIFTFSNLMAMPFYVLDALLVRINLAADVAARGLTFEAGLALLDTIAGIGGIVGGIIVSTWGGLKRRRVFGIIIPISVAFLAQIVLGASSRVYLTAAMAGVVGMMVPIMASHSQAIWQLQTPFELQGRVFAVRRMIAGVTEPLAYVYAGWLARSINPGHILSVLGVLGLAYALLQLLNPAMMRVEDREWVEGFAADYEKEAAATAD